MKFLSRVSACFLLLAVSVTTHAAPAPRPNILLIMVDDMGFSDLGCYGGDVDTPHLDALAKGGLRYTQFYNTGRCWPTRASLLTGYYPHQVGHAMKYGPKAPPAYQGTNREQAQMIPEFLGPAGYRCYHVGKWHLDAGGDTTTWPLGRGFDRSYWVKNQNNFFNPYVMMDEHHPVKRPGADGDYYITSAFSDRTVHYLEEHAAYHAEKPFFLYLAHTAPHFPLHALQEDIDRFKGRYRQGWDEVRKERLARLKRIGIVSAEQQLPPRDEDAVAWDSLSEEEKDMWDTRMAIHAAMVYRVDVGIGQIVKQLRKMKVLDNTLILFLSDNGASAEYLVRGDGHDPAAPPGSGASYLCMEVGWANASNTPFRLHKMWMHEGGISTPLIAHWPQGIESPNTLVRHPSHVIDIVPTLAELGGATIATQLAGRKLPQMPGISLAPTFQDQPPREHEFIFWEHVGHRALRMGDWKLVAQNQQSWELYNLASDRSETRDVIDQEPELARKLQARWQSFADEIGVVEWETLPQSKRSPGPDYRTK